MRKRKKSAYRSKQMGIPRATKEIAKRDSILYEQLKKLDEADPNVYKAYVLEFEPGSASQLHQGIFGGAFLDSLRLYFWNSFWIAFI